MTGVPRCTVDLIAIYSRKENTFTFQYAGLLNRICNCNDSTRHMKQNAQQNLKYATNFDLNSAWTSEGRSSFLGCVPDANFEQ
jgi:hypothetical protein